MLMKKLVVLVAAQLLLCVTGGTDAGAQVSKEFVGSWTLVSAISEKDGVKSDIFGPHAKGMLVFDIELISIAN